MDKKTVENKLKLLCDKYGVPMPYLKVNSNYLYGELLAEIEYDLEYDECTINISYGKCVDSERINEAIAHEFAHYMTKEVGMLQSLLAPEMKGSIAVKLFRHSAEKIASRLQDIFLEHIKD